MIFAKISFDGTSYLSVVARWFYISLIRVKRAQVGSPKLPITILLEVTNIRDQNGDCLQITVYFTTKSTASSLYI